MLQEEFEKSIKKFMIGSVNTVKKSLYQGSGFFELFGIDFVLDDELNLWLLEIDASPSLYWASPNVLEYYKILLEDSFEIVLAMRKQRL